MTLPTSKKHTKNLLRADHNKNSCTRSSILQRMLSVFSRVFLDNKEVRHSAIAHFVARPKPQNSVEMIAHCGRGVVYFGDPKGKQMGLALWPLER
jgi:hypothetical protein